MPGLLAKLLGRGSKRPLICTAIVPAAGSARRMEGIDKILAPLGEGEEPVLVHTLRRLQLCPLIHEIIVVTRQDLIVPISQLCKDWTLDKVSKVLVGGEERIHSVRAGLREVREDAELIAIHDGARPFVSQAVLEEVLLRAAVTGAAAPAVPLVDTIKRARDGLVEETVDRSVLWAVQTPQVFQASLIKAAVEKAIQDGAALTDDCSAVERLGMKVSLTNGDRANLKVTTPFDLMVGEAILCEEEGGPWT